MKRWKRIVCLTVAFALAGASISGRAEDEDGTVTLSPYHEVLVGVQEVGPDPEALLGVQDTKDLEAFCGFIEDKKTQLLEGGPEVLAAAGIPEGIACAAAGSDFQDISRQILAMTAVCRDYTFYNRIVCQWYAENLWNETWTYRIAESGGQETAVETLLSMASGTVSCLGAGNALGAGTAGLEALLDGRYRDTAVLGKRSSQELYGTDFYAFTIPVEWEGWTEENRAECEELLAMDEETFAETLLRRQEESLLASPVPFYKQGASEWGSEPFGNGTLASDACCPTAIAMVLSYFKGERITPSQVAARYDQDAYRSREQGSYGGKMCLAAAEDYGLSAETGTDSLSAGRIREALESGAKIVMSMKPGDGGGRYATVYHYVVLAGLTEDGKVIVNNPGINTDVTYDDMETVLDNQSGRGYGIFWED